jgi:excisionase family DNA binding protein
MQEEESVRGVRLLDQKEVAELLGVSTKTLEAWRCKRKGPKYFKIGRLARYTEAEVMKYLNELIEKGVGRMLGEVEEVIENNNAEEKSK